MLRVLLASGPVFVVWKPAGVLTQAPPGIDSLEQHVRDWVREREGKTGNIYLGVPHRLDRPVSGAMIFARHVRAARRISEQFEDRRIGKRYWACVSGKVGPAEGVWEDYLRKVPGQPQAEVVAPTDPDAQHARLRYRTLGQATCGSWLEIELETGRTHQIRIQAASRGWPVWGDLQYGAASEFGPPLADLRLRPIALHARSLDFQHPTTREPVQVVAPLPAVWRTLGLPLSDDDYMPD